MTTCDIHIPVSRREYELKVIINNRKIEKVIIDSHYELKHQNSINDELILNLVKLLNNGTFPAQTIDEEFEYFVTDNLTFNEKRYKLIWLLEKDQIYIGVINAYRR